MADPLFITYTCISVYIIGTTVTAGQTPQQIIVQGQPPPQLQTQIQLAQPHLGPPPPVSSPGPSGPVPPPLVTTIQPELQLVSQPGPLPMWGSPAVQAPVQHSVFSQVNSKFKYGR